ncbi:acylphosphatase [Vagococcus vulneris]|uniref:acylphosphatase n=2 Tax=Vagococcus vulneris TaxID=1977869 RepID=A0A429ZZ70_9ENTE|nr:acylphosphatase [Vagococcus vulneris]
MSIQMIVSGRVQGVGFRYLTKMTAEQIGVTGLVKNLNDGSVYIEADGTDEQLEQFIAAVKKSPSPSGRVSDCQIHYNTSNKIRSSFDVSY